MGESTSPPAARVTSSMGDAATLMSRRKFTRAGLATPVVLSTLASKPVLASSARNCTISGQVSGNVSSPGDANCAALGYSPAYWASEATWPDGFVRGELPNDSCQFSGNDAGTRFAAVFGARAFTYSTTGTGTSRACTVAAVSVPGYLTGQSATLLQVLKTNSAPTELGRQAVASLLNAHQNRLLDPPYPLSPTQVINIFSQVWRTGRYVVNSGVSWDTARVIRYLQSINGADD